MCLLHKEIVIKRLCLCHFSCLVSCVLTHTMSSCLFICWALIKKKKAKTGRVREKRTGSSGLMYGVRKIKCFQKHRHVPAGWSFETWFVPVRRQKRNPGIFLTFRIFHLQENWGLKQLVKHVFTYFHKRLTAVSDARNQQV